MELTSVFLLAYFAYCMWDIQTLETNFFKICDITASYFDMIAHLMDGG